MNVQGIYDTRGYMSSFFSRSEYQATFSYRQAWLGQFLDSTRVSGEPMEVPLSQAVKNTWPSSIWMWIGKGLRQFTLYQAFKIRPLPVSRHSSGGCLIHQTNSYDRYEMHVEEVKPEDLSVGFLREFMDLPTSTDDGEDYTRYRKFKCRISRPRSLTQTTAILASYFFF